MVGSLTLLFNTFKILFVQRARGSHPCVLLEGKPVEFIAIQCAGKRELLSKKWGSLSEKRVHYSGR